MLHLTCQLSHLVEHIFNKNAVPRGRIVDENVGHSSYQLAALKDGAAAQECGQERTTNFRIRINY